MRVQPADLLIYVVASLATGVAAQGMWRFFGDVLDFPPALRVLMFAFVEVAVVTSAVRARRSLRERGTAGADGAAVWALTGLSAVLSAMDTRSFPESVFRLAAPLVAAWLWERGMATERRAHAQGSGGIHWRVTPARILVRLGLAEPTGRGTNDVAAAGRLLRLALAVKRARSLRDAGAPAWRQRRALARLDAAMEGAVRHTMLADDPIQQQALVTQIAAVRNAASLLDVGARPPWAAIGSGPANRDRIAGSPSPDRGASSAADRIADPTRLQRSNGSPPAAGAVGSSADRADSGVDTNRPSGRTARTGARPKDVARARAAVAAGTLPTRPTAAAIRALLGISPAYARATRGAVNTEITPEKTTDTIQQQPSTPSPKSHEKEPPNPDRQESTESQTTAIPENHEAIHKKYTPMQLT